VTETAVRAFIGLGSNLGDRLANLKEAVLRLAKTEGVDVTRVSRVYETSPVGPPQPDFLNAVAEVWTSLSAMELLAVSLRIEEEMGRVRDERWGPRVIDLDLLNYGRMNIDEQGLIVPHPRMHERAFVLVPLLELEADPLLPGDRKAKGLRLGRSTRAAVRPFAPPIERP
jgi:2-amino-4-hydroxy-6-hydroxymethyldihydropteridine diphosphokinase